MRVRAANASYGTRQPRQSDGAARPWTTNLVLSEERYGCLTLEDGASISERAAGGGCHVQKHCTQYSP